jgi:hypothetical protein
LNLITLIERFWAKWKGKLYSSQKAQDGACSGLAILGFWVFEKCGFLLFLFENFKNKKGNLTFFSQCSSSK